MSIALLPPPVVPQPSKNDLLCIATRRLFEFMCAHVLICCWILFFGVRLRLLAPAATIFLMNVNLLYLAERSWKVQASTMPLWHPAVQLVFCVARMVQGAAAILAAVLWLRVAVLCWVLGGC